MALAPVRRATHFAVALVLLTLVPLAAQDVVVAIGPDTSYDAYYYDTHEGQIWTWSPGRAKWPFLPMIRPRLRTLPLICWPRPSTVRDTKRHCW